MIGSFAGCHRPQEPIHGVPAPIGRSRDPGDHPMTTPKAKAKNRNPKPTHPSSSKSRPNTKQAQLVELMRRPQGATIDEIATATGWQNHSVRGAISGALKK